MNTDTMSSQTFACKNEGILSHVKNISRLLAVSEQQRQDLRKEVDDLQCHLAVLRSDHQQAVSKIVDAANNQFASMANKFQQFAAKEQSKLQSFLANHPQDVPTIEPALKFFALDFLWCEDAAVHGSADLFTNDPDMPKTIDPMREDTMTKSFAVLGKTQETAIAEELKDEKKIGQCKNEFAKINDTMSDLNRKISNTEPKIEMNSDFFSDAFAMPTSLERGPLDLLGVKDSHYTDKFEAIGQDAIVGASMEDFTASAKCFGGLDGYTTLDDDGSVYVASDSESDDLSSFDFHSYKLYAERAARLAPSRSQ